jgi:hypothetical protein
MEDEMKRTALIMLAMGFFLIVQAAQAQWTPVKRLTWTSNTSEFPEMAIDTLDRLHVVWTDLTPGDKEIYYKRKN